MKVVSACLAGVKCKYDGYHRANQKVIDLVEKGVAIPLCPEQLGGLPTPRAPAEMVNGRIITNEGEDITNAVTVGSEEGLKQAKLNEAKEAILKSKSPTCGCGKVYDGSFSGKLVDGDGVFATLLKDNGFNVITEEDLH